MSFKKFFFESIEQIDELHGKGSLEAIHLAADRKAKAAKKAGDTETAKSAGAYRRRANQLMNKRNDRYPEYQKKLADKAAATADREQRLNKANPKRAAKQKEAKGKVANRKFEIFKFHRIPKTDDDTTH